jgi:hypothetical protein
MTPSQFKTVRQHLGYSAKLLAFRWGITPAAISHWESGRTRLPRVAEDALAFVATLPRPAPPKTRASDKYREGARFGHLVIRTVHGKRLKTKHNNYIEVTVECDCGTTKTIRASSLATVRQCCGRCPSAKDPMPPCTPAPAAPEILEALSRVVVPPITPPRVGPNHRAKIKRAETIAPVQVELPKVADDDGGGEDILGLDATPLEELRYMARKRKEQEEREGEQNEIDAAVNASWEEGLEEEDDGL